MDALRLKGTKMDSGERARVDLENDPCISVLVNHPH